MNNSKLNKRKLGNRVVSKTQLTISQPKPHHVPLLCGSKFSVDVTPIRKSKRIVKYNKKKKISIKHSTPKICSKESGKNDSSPLAVVDSNCTFPELNFSIKEKDRLDISAPVNMTVNEYVESMLSCTRTPPLVEKDACPSISGKSQEKKVQTRITPVHSVKQRETGKNDSTLVEVDSNCTFPELNFSIKEKDRLDISAPVNVNIRVNEYVESMLSCNSTPRLVEKDACPSISMKSQEKKVQTGFTPVHYIKQLKTPFKSSNKQCSSKECSNVKRGKRWQKQVSNSSLSTSFKKNKKRNAMVAKDINQKYTKVTEKECDRKSYKNQSQNKSAKAKRQIIASLMEISSLKKGSKSINQSNSGSISSCTNSHNLESLKSDTASSTVNSEINANKKRIDNKMDKWSKISSKSIPNQIQELLTSLISQNESIDNTSVKGDSVSGQDKDNSNKIQKSNKSSETEALEPVETVITESGDIMDFTINSQKLQLNKHDVQVSSAGTSNNQCDPVEMEIEKGLMNQQHSQLSNNIHEIDYCEENKANSVAENKAIGHDPPIYSELLFSETNEISETPANTNQIGFCEKNKGITESIVNNPPIRSDVCPLSPELYFSSILESDAQANVNKIIGIEDNNAKEAIGHDPPIYSELLFSETNEISETPAQTIKIDICEKNKEIKESIDSVLLENILLDNEGEDSTNEVPLQTESTSECLNSQIKINSKKVNKAVQASAKLTEDYFCNTNVLINNDGTATLKHSDEPNMESNKAVQASAKLTEDYFYNTNVLINNDGTATLKHTDEPNMESTVIVIPKNVFDNANEILIKYASKRKKKRSRKDSKLSGKWSIPTNKCESPQDKSNANNEFIDCKKIVVPETVTEKAKEVFASYTNMENVLGSLNAKLLEPNQSVCTVKQNRGFSEVDTNKSKEEDESFLQNESNKEYGENVQTKDEIIIKKISELNPEIYEKLKRINIKIYGKQSLKPQDHSNFSKIEIKILKENWKKFCEEYGFKRQEIEPFLRYTHINKGPFNQNEKIKFLQYLSQNLNCKNLQLIYHRFLRHCLSIDVTPGCQPIFGNIEIAKPPRNATELKKILVSRRMPALIRTGRVNDWISINNEEIWKRVHSYPKKKTCEINDIKDLQTTAKIYHTKIWPRSFTDTPIYKYAFKIKLINNIRNHFHKWEDVKWENLSAQFSNLGPVFLYCEFRKMIKKYVPQTHWQNLEKCANFLHEQILPIYIKKSKDDYQMKKYYAKIKVV